MNKQKLTALSEIRDKAGNVHREGQVFEADDQEAQELIRTGQARAEAKSPEETGGKAAEPQSTSRK